MRGVIENPHLILKQMEKKIESQSQSNRPSPDKEISKLQRSIEKLDRQEKRLITLFSHSEMNEKSVLDAIKQFKAERETCQQKLMPLLQMRNQTLDMVTVKEQFTEYCETVRQNLNSCTLQGKRLALDALNVRVFATQERVDIKLAVPLEFITIEQTSA